MSDTFICASCLGEFIKGRSDEEAQAEAEQIWSEQERNQPQEVICDLCYTRLMRWQALVRKIRN
jgi:hypothetical protein